jgi:hypothetical protein
MNYAGDLAQGLMDELLAMNMTQADIIAMAREAGFETLVRKGRICGFDRDNDYTEELQAFAILVAAAERNKLAAWMMAQGYATGHGDTMEGLLEELEREINFKRAELWLKRINEAVLTEREAVEDLLKEYDMATSAFAKDFRAKGQP